MVSNTLLILSINTRSNLEEGKGEIKKLSKLPKVVKTKALEVDNVQVIYEEPSIPQLVDGEKSLKVIAQEMQDKKMKENDEEIESMRKNKKEL